MEKIKRIIQEDGGDGSGFAVREILDILFSTRKDALEEARRTAWDIASNSSVDTFEDVREEVDTAIRSLIEGGGTR